LGVKRGGFGEQAEHGSALDSQILGFRIEPFGPQQCFTLTASVEALAATDCGASLREQAHTSPHPRGSSAAVLQTS